MPADAPGAKPPKLPSRPRKDRDKAMDRIVQRYREVIREDEEREEYIRTRKVPPTLEQLEAQLARSARLRRRRRRT